MHNILTVSVVLLSSYLIFAHQMGLSFLIALVPAFLHFHFGILHHFLLRWHRFLATQELHHEAHLQIEHLRCAHIKWQSDQRHCWPIDIDAMFVQWLHIVVIHRNTAVNAQKWERIFVSLEIKNILYLYGLMDYRMKREVKVILIMRIGIFNNDSKIGDHDQSVFSGVTNKYDGLYLCNKR